MLGVQISSESSLNTFIMRMSHSGLLHYLAKVESKDIVGSSPIIRSKVWVAKASAGLKPTVDLPACGFQLSGDPPQIYTL